MHLTRDEAVQELFTNHYRVWESDPDLKRMSNGPADANVIDQLTANHLRNIWSPGSKPNTWNQTRSSGGQVKVKKGNANTPKVDRWVTRSVSGGSDVVDFHAYWQGVTFLWHMKIAAPVTVGA